jgi:hypothetical protein
VNTETKTFDDLRQSVHSSFFGVPQWSDVEILLDFISTRPGEEMPLGALMDCFEGDATEKMRRVIGASVILSGPIHDAPAELFLKVRSDLTEEYHTVSDLDPHSGKPYTLRETGETFDDVAERTTMHLRVASFEPPAPLAVP